MVFVRRTLFPDYWKIVRREPLVKRIKMMYNDMWENFPEVMALSPLIVTGIGGAAWLLPKLYELRHTPPKYYKNVTVFRPNDPRVATIRKDNTLLWEHIS